MRDKESVYAYHEFLFGLVVYGRVGGVSFLEVCGLAVYDRIGDHKWLFGIHWGGDK